MDPTCAVCGSQLVFERGKPHKILCPLHVAAPELLAACKAALEWLDDKGTIRTAALTADELAAAIAKAEGR